MFGYWVRAISGRSPLRNLLRKHFDRKNLADIVTAARDFPITSRFSTKKGLLFYGPPGTGKTHTVHYLASQLPEHTTLLITAEQVAIIGEYFRLARFLQPAMMVIEDVDLIARERAHMQNPAQEVLLNKLLNEMDGLREDADVLFILTTNRPEQLEPALASRPGRIDQAIEFPPFFLNRPWMLQPKKWCSQEAILTDAYLVVKLLTFKLNGTIAIADK